MSNALDNAILNWNTDIQDSLDADMMSFDGNSDLFDCFNTDRQAPVAPHEAVAASAPLSITSSDLQVPSLSFSADLDNTPSDRTDQRNAISFQSLVDRNTTGPLTQLYERRSKVDSRCIIACTHIVTTLENYILADLKALDLVLEIVKKTVDKVGELISVQEDSKSFCCLALFSVIMHQVMGLLEAGCAGLAESRDQASQGPASGLDRIGCGIPVFGFGTFQMDPEEHHAWRAQIVVKELQRSERVLQKMAALGTGRRHEGQAEVLGLWYQDLERRLGALRESLRRKEPWP